MLVHAQAQDIFDRRYDSFGLGYTQMAWSVEHRSSGGHFVVHLSGYDEPTPHFVTALLCIQEDGTLDSIETTLISGLNTYPGWSNSSGRCRDGGVVIGGGVNEPEDIQSAYLFRFDSTGRFIEQHRYLPYGSSWIGRQAKQTLDGGYVLCGDVFVTNGNGFLLRTDSLGALLWTREYGGNSTDYIVSMDLVGSGFYLGGMYRNVPSNFQIWTLRVDQHGEIIWERRWGGPFNDSNGHVQTTSDGHVLVAGNWPTAAGTYSNSYIFMAKLDSSNGSSIWEKRYGPATINTTLFAVKEVTPFGDLIATGQTTPEVLEEYGVLLRTAANGDSLWMRYYQYSDSLITGGAGQLRDVLPTSDGGFIAVGAAYGVSQNGQSYGQDAWVIKVDSMGCLEPGCHLLTGIETQVTNLKGALTVAPNPVRAGEAVQVHISLPPSITPQGPLRLTVVSGDGRVVQEQLLTPHSSLITLHTSFAPGLYHLHLSDGARWLAGAKVVVE
jgi:hypothetical protein